MNRRERRRASATSRPVQQRAEHHEAARCYHDAVEHLKSGRLAEAEIAHRRVLSLVPNHAPSLHHLGLIAYRRQEREGAIDFIRQSLSAKPDYHEAWLNLAIILGEMSRAKEAIDACRQCVALQPDNAESLAVLGNLLRVAENDVEAMAAYIDAIELKPEQPLVLTRIAELLLKSGQIEAATARCKRALELDPDLEEARILSRRLSAASRSTEALSTEIEQQSKTGAERAKKFDELATFLRDDRRYAESADICGRAIAADPGNADYHFNLALTLEASGLLQEALASYQAGLAIAPDRAKAYAGVGNLLRTMNMQKGAIQALEHAVLLDPALASAHYDLAVTFKQYNQYEEARAAFRKCIELAPDSITNRLEYVNLRRILCDWDGVDEDERYCLKALREMPLRIAPSRLFPYGQPPPISSTPREASSSHTMSRLRCSSTAIRHFTGQEGASESASSPAISSSTRPPCCSPKSWKSSIAPL